MKNRTLSLVFSIVAALLLVACNSNTRKLNRAVEEIDNLTPLGSGNMTIDRCRLENNNVIFTYTVDEDYVNLDVLRKNTSMSKRNLYSILMNMQDNQFLDLLVECDAGFGAEYIGSKSGKKITVLLEPDELADMYINSPMEPDYEAELTNKIESENLNANTYMSEGLMFKKCELTPSHILYTFVYNEDLYYFDQEVMNEMKREVINNYSNSDDLIAKYELKLFTNAKRGIRYRYIGQQTGKVSETTISLSELRRLL